MAKINIVTYLTFTNKMLIIYNTQGLREKI
jgi:hypothetical protein